MDSSPLRFLMKKLISHTRHLHSGLRHRWDFDSSEIGESAVYKHALKFQRPTTIKYKYHPINSASFIGTITYPLKKMGTRNGRLGVHTMLNGVPSSPSSARSIMIMMMMWDEMAEISMQYLKANDFVYVWGHLQSHIKPDQNGNPRLLYKVDVKEINYVARHDQGANFPESEKLLLSGWRDTETSFTCGKCSSAAPMNGGTAGGVRRILDIQILSTRILVKLFGSILMILHGSRDNFNCLILGWLNKAYKIMELQLLTSPHLFMMTHKNCENLIGKEKISSSCCLISLDTICMEEERDEFANDKFDPDKVLWICSDN